MNEHTATVDRGHKPTAPSYPTGEQPPSQVLVSCCIIVKNEKEMLPGCLLSITGWVDEIIVVDTGSTDETPEIARSFGAKVLHQPWEGNFSTPRNLALSHARGKWVLVLDADERLAAGAQRALKAALHQDQFDCGLLPLYNANDLHATVEEVVRGDALMEPPQLLPRLFRNYDDLRWERSIHEQPASWFGRGSKRMAVLEQGSIVHYGGIPAFRKQRGKDERNLALLEERCKAHPEDYASHRHLAYNLLHCGERGRARTTIEHAFETIRPLMNAGLPVSQRPAHVLITTLYASFLREDGECHKAIEVLEMALSWSPSAIDSNHPNLHFQLGLCLEALALNGTDDERRGLLDRARIAYQHCLRCQNEIFSESVNPAGCTGRLAWIRLGAVLLQSDNPGPARHAFEQALMSPGADIEARLGLAEAQLACGQPAQCLDLIEALIDPNSPVVAPEPLTLAALAHHDTGDHNRSLAYAKRAVDVMKSRPFVLPHLHRRLSALCKMPRSEATPPS